jgi:TNF receptor-associated factor 2/TNF receptor-associated factor 3
MFFELEKELQSAVAQIKEYDTMKTVFQETIALQNKKIEEQACENAKLHSQLEAKVNDHIMFLKSSMDGKLSQLTKSFEQLQRTMKVHISEVDPQLQASPASTQPGSLLWRIPEVARKRCDDIEGTSIYSPPFYSGRNGYKMCMRAYLNGDGIGFNTHLSVFFILMRGEYDPLLKWPFESKVSLILVDQNLRQHIVQTLNPSPESSSFQQPCLDMNVASGCHQFAKLSVLEEGNYVKDDVMFLKCIVDTVLGIRYYYCNRRSLE